MLNIFRKRKCGNCKHWAPNYPDAPPEALGYLMGHCEHVTASSGFLTGDFAAPTGKGADKALYVGRNFSCNRHEFK